MKSDLKIKEKKLKLTTLGFTLVELLAVIVILAIIALIAIPLIGNVIEKAKIGALESSVNGLVESANMYYANETIKGETISETVFDFEDGEQIGTKKLEYKGKVYNGKLILHTNGEVAVCIDDEEHYAYKNKDTDEIISGVGTCLYDGTTGDFSSNSPVEDLKQQIAAATATSDKVLEGNTIYTSVGLVAGTMTDKSGTTTTATTITENGDNALITIPANGYYSTSSKISVPIETITNSLATKINSLKPALSTVAVQSSQSFTCVTDGYVFGYGATNSIIISVNGVGSYRNTRDGVKVSKGDVISTNGNGQRNFALFETNSEISLDTSNPTVVPDMTDWTAPSDGYIISVGSSWLSIEVNEILKAYGNYGASYPVSKGDVVYCNGNDSRGHAFYSLS